MKKIAILIASLSGGGAERVTLLLADYLSRHNQVTLIVYKGSKSEYQHIGNYDIEYLPNNSNKVKDIINKRKRLLKILKSNNPEYVISLGAYPHVLFSGIYLKYKCIFSERNDPNQDNLFGKICKLIIFGFSKKVVFQTNDAKAYYPWFIQNKGIIIQNPISPLLPKAYNGIRDKRFVACNRLEPQKNIYMMLRAFSKFLKEFPDYTLEIYGDGSLKENLFKECLALNIDANVRFMGFVNPLHEHIIKASGFLLSSNYEGLSNSMIEAMAIGIPVICTDCPIGGARDIIKSGENGILVPVNDADAMYVAMKSLIKDFKLTSGISNNAVKIREYLEVSSICNRWEMIVYENDKDQ